MHTHWGKCPTAPVRGTDLKIGDLLNFGHRTLYKITAFRDGIHGNDFTIDTRIYRGRNLVTFGGFNDRDYEVVETSKCLGTG
jgi:hypothetical protein